MSAKKELLEFIMEATAGKKKRAAKGVALKGPALKLAKMLKAGRFGCQAETARGIIEEVFEIKLGREWNPVYRFGYRPGEAVVPVSNPNFHNYSIGKVYVIMVEDYAVGTNGRVGNHLPRKRKDWVRKATEAEIKAFVSKMKPEIAKGLLERIA